MDKEVNRLRFVGYTNAPMVFNLYHSYDFRI